MQPSAILIFLLAFGSNPLLWFFAILYLAQNYRRFSVRVLLVVVTVVAIVLGMRLLSFD